MSATMMIPMDKMLAEIGKLHLQVQQQQEQLGHAQRLIQEQDKSQKVLTEELRLANEKITELRAGGDSGEAHTDTPAPSNLA